jgi:hypothetical protein
VAKRDGPSKRLRAAIARAKRGRAGDPPPVPETFEGITIPPHGLFALGVGWKPVAKAFRAFGYDPRNPLDWEKLISAFAEVHFSAPRRKTKTWNDGSLCQLAADAKWAESVIDDEDDEEICKRLVEISRYKKFAVQTLRRRLPDARKVLADTVSSFAKSALDTDKKAVEAWVIKKYVAYNKQPHFPLFDLTIDDLLAGRRPAFALPRDPTIDGLILNVLKAKLRELRGN